MPDIMSFEVDPKLKQDFELACHKSGRNMTEVFDAFARQFIRNPDVVFPNVPRADTVKSPVITEEELLRRVARVKEGHYVEVSMEELEALETEEPGGPTFQRIEQRRKAVKADG